MGMDVYGKAPTSDEGEYFRNNVWWWRPLADYVQKVAPTITCACQYWHSNDGDGLDAEDSVKLADALQDEIDTGRCAQYAADYEEALNALPRVTCEHCEGTGVRSDPVGVNQGMTTKVIDEPGHPRHGQVGWCNACGGHGSCKSWDASYPFSVENVQEFVTFLRASGGFEIS